MVIGITLDHQELVDIVAKHVGKLTGVDEKRLCVRLAFWEGFYSVSVAHSDGTTPLSLVDEQNKEN